MSQNKRRWSRHDLTPEQRNTLIAVCIGMLGIAGSLLLLYTLGHGQ